MQLHGLRRYIRANQATFALMASSSVWTSQQAAHLLAGYCPDEFQEFSDASEADIEAVKEVSEFEKLTRLAPSDKLTPSEWVQFAIEKGIEPPAALMKFFPGKSSIFELYGKLESESDLLRKEQVALAGKIDQSEAAKARIAELEQQLENAKKTLGTTERNTLLTIIAAFCKYESLDPTGRGTAAEIMRITDDLGAHIDDGTIRRWLGRIPEALESRKK